MKRRIFLLSLLFLVALATWRISSGPISVNFLTPYFEKILSRNADEWQVTAGETVLAWRGWSRPVDLNLRDVEVHDRDGAQVVKLPVVSVGLSLRALLHGEVGVRRVEILRAELMLERDQTGRVAISAEATNASEGATVFAFDLIEQLLKPSDAAHPISFLELVRVEADSVTWRDKARKIDLTAAPLTLDARRTEDGLRCDVALQLDSGKRADASGPRLQVVATAHHKENEPSHLVTADTAGGDLAVSVVARANDINVAELGRYWPVQVADSARSWVVDNIRSGHVSEAVLNLAFEEKGGEGLLTQLDGTLRYDGLDVHYLADWPEAESVRGTGSFNKQGLHFDVASGSISDLGVGPTKIDISGLDSENERIQIRGNVSGESNAIADLVTRPSSNLVELLALDRAKSAERGTADLDIRFPLREDLSLADVAITANGNLPGLYAQNPYVHGLVTASVDFKMREGGEASVDLNMDLSRSAMTIPFLGWRKAEGVDGRAELSVDLHDLRPTGARDLKVDAGTLQARGTLRFRDGTELDSLELADVSLGQTHLSTVTLKDSADELRVDLGPGNLDIEAIRTGASEEGERREEEPSARNLVVHAANLRKVSFGEGRFLSDVSVHAERRGGGWSNVDLRGKTAGTRPGDFELELQPAEGGHQRLTASAADAGALLEVFGVASELKGGRLSVSGRTAPGGKTPVEARVEMRDYAFLRASLLTRLLTIASGRGFGKLTTNDSVAFDYLGGDLVLADGRITTEMIRAHGPALGFTAKGWLDIEQGQLRLDGAIVPAYAANHILGKIPVLGSLLSGDGAEGFWAIRYRMRGNAKDPKMEVDALTSLTPAFLREVFGKLEAAAER